MRITNYAELVSAVTSQKKKSRVAVVAANDVHTIESVVIAQQKGLIEALLIGNKQAIIENLEMNDARPDDYTIFAASDVSSSLEKAIELINTGAADVLMKGKIETGKFMGAILKKENNLRKGKLLSVAGFFEIPTYHKLLLLSDMAINTYPDFEAKVAIVQNAVGLLQAIGIEMPKIAVLAAVEKVNPKMKETVDASELKKMNQLGQITDCIIDGPLSFDIATSAEAAKAKDYQSEVAGDADALIVPDLVSGNILAKALTGFAGSITAGTVLGAAVPVVLVPRSAEASDKFYSIALAAYMAQAV